MHCLLDDAECMQIFLGGITGLWGLGECFVSFLPQGSMVKYLRVKWYDVCDFQMVPQKEKLDRDEINEANYKQFVTLGKRNMDIYRDGFSVFQ